MKKTWMLFVIVGVLVLTIFSGCEFFAAMLTSVSGTVVDAKSQDLGGVSGVTVNLSTRDGSVKYSTTTESDGSFIISGVDPGTYIVSAKASGWFFAPKEVYVGGMAQDLGYVLGFQIGESAKTTNDTISLILVWDENFEDVDLHFTYPESDYSASHQTFTTPYEDFGSSDVFGPGITIDPTNSSNGPTINSGRGHIYYNAKHSYRTVGDVNGTLDNRYAIQLDRDDYGYNDYDYSYDSRVRKGPRVETLSINTIPYFPGDTTTSISPTTGNELPSGSTFRWLGVMELYANAFDKSHDSNDTSEDYLSIEGEYGGAGVTLYVVQGSTLKGVYHVPDATKIKTASLVRINFFLQNDPSQSNWVYYYQILPDIKVFQSVDYIKSLNTNNNIIEVSAKGRTK